jgi:hypothetical protein
MLQLLHHGATITDEVVADAQATQQDGRKPCDNEERYIQFVLQAILRFKESDPTTEE